MKFRPRGQGMDAVESVGRTSNNDGKVFVPLLPLKLRLIEPVPDISLICADVGGEGKCVHISTVTPVTNQ